MRGKDGGDGKEGTVRNDGDDGERRGNGEKRRVLGMNGG